MDLVRLPGRSPRSDYDNSPGKPRRSRKNSYAIPPPAPDVPGDRDDEPPSPRRRRPVRERSSYRDRDSDWDRRQDDEILLRTPESRTSSSSYLPSRQHYYGPNSRRDQSTEPSHSVVSSMTSIATPHPPRSSATRQSQLVYRRPSVSIRDPSPMNYEDEVVHERRTSRSQSRSIRMVPVAPSPPVSRRPSRSRSRSRPKPRTLSRASFSSSDSDDDGHIEDVHDSHDDHRATRGRKGETQLVRVRRDERSLSRAETSRRSDDRSRRRIASIERDREICDELDARAYHSPDERIRERGPRRQLSRPPSLPRSRPASVRHIPAASSDHEHDADSEEPPARTRRDQLERRESRRDNHSPRTSRDHKRNRSESYSKRSPPFRRSSSKQYYESEDRTIEKRDKHHPPSSSRRKVKTISVSGSGAASQQQSVSSSKRPSVFGSFFGSSHYGPSHHHAPSKPPKVYECVACLDEYSSRKLAKLKCGHRMCNTCLKQIFKLSISDPQHMPPKCCTADFIPLNHVDQLFDRSFKKTWNKKFVEYSARNRVYCPKRHCNEFIRPENIRKGSDGKRIGQCSRCSTKVCVQCGGKSHKGRDCPKDEETVRFLAQAKDEGWQRCLKCKAMIELEEGCNHMTCRCGAEFCYVCGTKWKSCDCPWFNYEAVEADRLQHMQLPRNPARPTVDIPLTPTREGRPGGPRLRSETYEEEVLYRNLQREHDEHYGRPLQAWREDERDNDFREGFGDITALGNAAGHFLNEDFRLRAHHKIAPRQQQPPHAPAVPIDPSPPPMFDHRTAPAGDYVHNVSRARGVGVVRASSMTRLADRFTARGGGPPPVPTAATMPPSAPAPVMTPATMAGGGLAPGPQIRRHTVETAEISSKAKPRPPTARVTVMRGAQVVYAEPEEMTTTSVAHHKPKHVPVVRKQHVREAPKGPVLSSAMAGLTKGGSYENRVHEWRMYVGGGGCTEPPAEMVS